MKSCIMIAEKPSLAQSLAKILSYNNYDTQKGVCPSCPIHSFTGPLSCRNEKSVLFKMTSVTGHVYGLDFLPEFNSWDRTEPGMLFSAGTRKEESNPKMHMSKALQQAAKGCDYVILWLDCDKEGENICFEVLENVIPKMNVDRGRLDRDLMYRNNVIMRAKFSSITDKDIRAAMNCLIAPNENESLSVDARQELDLRIGCAFTRFQTRYFQGKYGNLDSNLISYGPCQTPTLGLVVERHDRIQSFEPEPFWAIEVSVKRSDSATGPGASSGRGYKLEWGRGRVFDRTVAVFYEALLKGEYHSAMDCSSADKKKCENNYNYIRVNKVSKKEGRSQRPTALNTVELMKVASQKLGISPHYTMQVAERLYMQGYISYPRTETTQYPANFSLMDVVRMQAQSGNAWSDYCRDLMDPQHNLFREPRPGKDCGDHPPITPMRPGDEADLGGDMWRLYDYIVRHFLATISADCKYMKSTARFVFAGEEFSYSGKVVVSRGYTDVYFWDEPCSGEEAMPDFIEGEECVVDSINIRESKTSPPDYLTEAELIGLMEKHGIGTDASISVHINNICERNFVQLQSGRKMVPTNLGVVLIHGYQKIDPDLALPTMRAAVEQQLNLIAAGKADYNSVLQHALGIFRSKFEYFTTHIPDMDELFEVSFSPLAATGKPLSKCGKCRRYMKYVSMKPARLHCTHCDETYSLPQNGTIKLYKELKCPLDDFELVVYSTGSRGKAYPLCPYCYNNPPFEDITKGMGCNTCPSLTCKHARPRHGAGPCLECETGVLVIDPISAPKWRIACNVCQCVVRFQEDLIHKVETLISKDPKALLKMNASGSNGNASREDDSLFCDSCGCALLNVEFNKNKTPLPDNATSYEGCVFCDDILISVTTSGHAKRVHPGSRRGGGRRKGGRKKLTEKQLQMIKLLRH
eukprot:Nk52_evm56s2367 gene=Nk52_evmTU56s2367